jgi:mono/diheme cytochrome c family protein
MFKKVLKWFGIVLGSLLGLIILAAAVFFIKGNQRFSKTYQAPTDQLTIPTDAASIARGQHFAAAICEECHGSNLSGGKILFQAPPLGQVKAANLTSGKGGRGATFTDADWVRAIRYGVKPDGKSVVIMPSYFFYNFTDQDLADIIAYIKSVPPVDNTVTDVQVTPLAKVLIGAGKLNMPFSASLIPFDTQRADSMQPSASADYGAYLVSVSGCHECHGAQLSGGKDPDPTAPPAPNLTPGGLLGKWSEADFINTIRTGVTPENLHLEDFMPWKTFRNYSDDDLKAIWTYLHSLPAMATTIQ